jgi:hypothetical protein
MREVAQMRRQLAMVLLLAGICSVCKAQVLSNALVRVFYIKVGQQTGTAFTIEQNGRQYLVTAKHVVSSLPPKGAHIQIFQMADWHDLTVNILYCKSKDVDIAVLEIPNDISARFELEPDRGSVLIGRRRSLLRRLSITKSD